MASGVSCVRILSAGTTESASDLIRARSAVLITESLWPNHLVTLLIVQIGLWFPISDSSCGFQFLSHSVSQAPHSHVWQGKEGFAIL